MRSIACLIIVCVTCVRVQSFSGIHRIHRKFSGVRSQRMVADIDFAHIHSVLADIPHWMQYASQGIADAPQCPGFGQPGWAPFCFLQGNPVFNAFDSFQSFVQASVVSLHDVLQKNLGIQNAYGPSIVLFTLMVRLLVFPLNFQQLASSQKTMALNPMIAEIREKYPDNKEIQQQMVALLYQETQVLVIKTNFSVFAFTRVLPGQSTSWLSARYLPDTSIHCTIPIFLELSIATANIGAFSVDTNTGWSGLWN